MSLVLVLAGMEEVREKEEGRRVVRVCFESKLQKGVIGGRVRAEMLVFLFSSSSPSVFLQHLLYFWFGKKMAKFTSRTTCGVRFFCHKLT